MSELVDARLDAGELWGGPYQLPEGSGAVVAQRIDGRAS
jgi:hypothetical protein